MSDTVGLVHCGQRRAEFLAPVDGRLQRDCSERTAREINEEVKKLLDSAYEQANQILGEHRTQLERVAHELLDHETLEEATFHELIGKGTTKARVLGGAQA